MKIEQYIPFDKEVLLERQIALNAFSGEEKGKFEKLFEILEHYFHDQGFNLIQKIKRNYAAFDPDKLDEERVKYIGKSDLSIFKSSLHQVLERGNYNEIDQTILNEAIENSDLVGLQLKINFDDFKEYSIYTRGQHTTTEKVKRFIFWEKEVELEYYDYVVIYINYKDATHFEKQKGSFENLPFTPGCSIIKLFKKVPKNDLETIFPNAVPKMSLKDKLLLWIPGLAGGISLLSAKVIPAIIKMYTAYKSGEVLNISNSKASLIQGLIALGILGAYLFRQYNNYVSKKIKFSKMLTDSLYFKNIGNNSGVIPLLIDTSEEEELKETILAYAFLSKSQEHLTAGELDTQIENWFQTEFQFQLDFDVEDALCKLKKIGLGIETNGKWTVLPLDKALVRIDELWDGIFNYNQAK
jgi:hypothetical protein